MLFVGERRQSRRLPDAIAASEASNQTQRDARAVQKLDVEDAVVALLQCARDPASLDVAELLR
jgi:hypothetical protein